MADPITFLSPRHLPYGAFSNFSGYTVRIFGHRWATSEHAYQASKFPTIDPVYDEIRNAASPRAAADKGRDEALKPRMRPTWESPLLSSDVEVINLATLTVDDGTGRRFVVDRVKDLVMFQIVDAKIRQHAPLTDLLLSTGDAPIIEASARDPYWGWGADRRGLNKLGRILMAIREQLRASV